MKGLRAKLNSLSLSDLGAGLRALQVASSQRAVLESLDVSLVLCDDVLINTLTGEYRRLDDSAPATLARAAASLLADKTPAPTVFLLLPPSHFVATRYQLQVSGEKLLRSALSLQVHTLLPSYEAPLLLGLAGSQGSGAALWYPAAEAAALCRAFQEQGLLLGALMPRTLALLDEAATGEAQVLVDSDAEHSTCVSFQHGSLSSFLTVSQHDLEQEVFYRQWQQETQRQQETQQSAGRPHPSVARCEGWRELRRLLKPQRGYAFIPADAEASGWRRIRRQQQKVGAVAALVLLGVLCLPFLNNAIRKTWLEHELESALAQSAVARESQAAVVALEDEWGAVLDYPRQDTATILLALNGLIENALSNFSLDKGVVDIQGISQDQALLIERLAENEAFFDVSQSRSSSAGAASGGGDRFGIRMSVSGVDFPAYNARHPATQP
ncbi:MAG: hypothetical protein LBF16_12170 [Pseudomonadales bacterium]|jgi:hypothetical protein|nr:hypothetical protein [Pseudomonadales bacterium]